MRFAVPRPLRAPCALGIAALGCSSGASAPPLAPAQAVPAAAELELIAPTPRARASAEPAPVVIAWSFRAGAPLAATPGIGPDGTVVVGSVDGYLNALRRDGSFRWGYTLRGPLIGRPAVCANGAVFAAADPNGLYALDGEGALLWVSSVSGGVSSPPVVDANSHVWITTGQGTLLGYSTRGGIVGFARIGGSRALVPAPLPEGGVAIASVDGNLRITGHAGAAPHAVSTPPLLELDVGRDGLFVLGSAGLSRFDTSGGDERWSRTSVTRVACSNPALVVVEDQGLRWLTAEGEPKARVSVPVGPQRAIACLEDGSLVLPDDAGVLLRVDASGVRGRARMPAGRIVSLDSTSDGLVIAGYRDGRVIALRPPG